MTQSWIYTYFPTLRPETNVTFGGEIPWAKRWVPSPETTRGRNYRVELDTLTSDQVSFTSITSNFGLGLTETITYFFVVQG